jgi:putative DNA primase/helicase
MVVIPEPPKGLKLDEALVKQLTGGDQISCRYLGGNPFQYLPSFKILIPTNHLPDISDPSLKKSKRMKYILFSETFINSTETDLKTKFRDPAAKSMILHWLISGYEMYVKDGHLESPDTLREELDEFFSDASGHFHEFLEVNLVEDEDSVVKVSEIHRLHNSLAKDRDLKTLTKHAFLPALRSVYPNNIKRDATLGNVLKGYKLVEVKPDEESNSTGTSTPNNQQGSPPNATAS